MRAGLAGRVTALSPVEVAGLPLRGIAGERERERPDGERHRQKRRYDDYGKEPGRPTDSQEITFWGGCYAVTIYPTLPGMSSQSLTGPKD